MTTRIEIDDVSELRRRLVARGFEPVAVATGGKRPVDFAWQRSAPCQTARVGALNTGLRCGRLVAADIDIDDPAEVDQAVAAIEEIAGPSPLIRFRDSAPRVLIAYRAGEEMKKRIVPFGSGKIEFLAHGQQFVAYGRHPCGDEFQWRDAAPDEIEADDLPALTGAAIDEIARRLGVQPEGPVLKPAADEPKPLTRQAAEVVSNTGERERAWALAALDGVIAEIASTAPGARSDTLNKGAFRLGGIVARGWLSEAEADGALRGAIAGWANQPKTINTLRRGLRDGRGSPHSDLLDDDSDDVARERRDRLAEELDAATRPAEPVQEMHELPAEEEPDTTEEEFPDELLHPPGLVGDIADWIDRTSPSPMRLFAVGAALVAVGAMVARQAYQSQRPTGSHLYVLIVGPTGTGKEWPQEALMKLMAAAGRMDIVTGSFSSEASFIARLLRQPAQVQIIDEISKIFRKLNNSKSSNSEASLLELYCTVWGKNTNTFVPEESTARSAKPIQRPWVSIYGATTPRDFHENLRSKNVANGFFNRFLVLPLRRRAPLREEFDLSRDVPADIAERISMLSRAFNSPGNLPQSDQHGRELPPEMRVIEATPEAEELLRGVKRAETEMMIRSDDDPLYEIWSRYAEMVRRVAMIVALGRHPNSIIACKVTLADVQWADAFVQRAMLSFFDDLRENIADNENQQNQKFVLSIIKKAKQISRRDLYQKIKGRFNTRTTDDIISSLEQAGNIEKKVLSGGPGVRPTLYTFRRAM